MAKGRTAAAGVRTKTGRKAKKKRKSKSPGRDASGVSPLLSAPLSPATAGIAWRGPHPLLSTCPAAVRVSTSQDAPAVAALWMEMNRLRAPLGEEWAVVDGAAERYGQQMASSKKNTRTDFLVAELEIEGTWRIAGFMHVLVKLRSSHFRESVVGEVAAICVAPDACGRGVGSSLIVAAMEWFRKRSITHVETTAAAGNHPARTFFRESGFRESASVMWAPVPPDPLPEGRETAGLAPESVDPVDES